MKKTYLKVLLILLLIGVLAYLVYAIFNNDSNKNKVTEKKNTPKEEEEESVPPVPKLQIIDVNSKTRPIAIMIDNEEGALPQAGLQDAFLIYEIIIEGGQTRMLAVFKDKDTAMIGPCRSARHYFLDYALENDAIYTHFGFSPQAQSDIRTLGVNNISGTQADGSAFWREKPLGGWHNVFTKISNLTSKAAAKGYRMISDTTTLLNYSIPEINLSTNENAKVANNVSITYSSSHNVSYVYDPISKTYNRYRRGLPHVDRVTGLQYKFKNIIVYDVLNYALNDGSGKGRQGLDNLGSGDGYYMTNGYAIPIRWEKTSRSGRTIYKDLSGTEIKINDGNTFINIQPINQALTIQ